MIYYILYDIYIFYLNTYFLSEKFSVEHRIHHARGQLQFRIFESIDLLSKNSLINERNKYIIEHKEDMLI